MLALILGLGESGLAMARWLAREGWALRVADTRAQPPMLERLRAELPQAEFIGGTFSAALLEGTQLLALSPGLSPTHSEAAPLVEAAAARGIEVVGEIELFARALQRLRDERDYRPRIVGVTGTNGKTTTTRLTGLLIERAGLRVAVAGNISPTALDSLRARLEADDLPQVWALELSSFQLATTRSLACDAAAVLNLSQDHLDWHGTMEAYAAAKARIFAERTVRVLNRDDPWVFAMQPAAARPAAKAKPSRSARVQAVAIAGSAEQNLAGETGDVAIPEAQEATRPVHAADHVERAARRERELLAPLVSFGTGMPKQPDEYGLLRDGGLMWLAYAEDMSMGQRRRKAAGELPGIEGQVHVHRLMPTEALRIRGRHNALNALAALALARAIGCPLAPMLHALRHYDGEPHRVQLLATIDGVQYYDDSKGTNVGATVAALEGLGSEGRALVVILGGDGKGQDFAPLVEPLARYARGVVLIGRDGARIGEVLSAAAYPVQRADTLAAAVDTAAQLARSGDAVLLSPACASLDMFRNYVHRAEAFIEAVRERAAQRRQLP